MTQCLVDEVIERNETTSNLIDRDGTLSEKSVAWAVAFSLIPILTHHRLPVGLAAILSWCARGYFQKTILDVHDRLTTTLEQDDAGWMRFTTAHITTVEKPTSTGL